MEYTEADSEAQAPFGQQLEAVFDDEDEELFDDADGEPQDVKEIIDKEAKKKIPRVDYKQKIFVLPGTPQSLAQEDLLFTSLPHPKRTQQARYMIHEKKVLEISRMREPPSAWFVDDSVDRDGSMYIATPVDPIFLYLQILEKSRKKTEEHQGYFCDLQQILSEVVHPGFEHLKDLLSSIDLSVICDVNDETGDETFYRLSDKKVVRWLRCKVERIVVELGKSELMSVSSGSSAATFRPSKKKKELTKEEKIKGALGFLSEYVVPERIQQLADSYGVKNFGPTKMTALDSLVMHPLDKPIQMQKRSQPDGDREGSPAAKRQKLSVAQARLAKTDTKGMSKISSFFTAKK